MRTRWLMIVTAGFLVAADAPEDAVKKEKAKLQGTWVLVAMERDGTWRETTEKEARDRRLVFTQDKFEYGLGEGRVIGTYVLDPGKKPKTVDLTIVAAQGVKVPEEDRPKNSGFTNWKATC